MSDPLTASTVHPSLQVLQAFNFVEEVTFVNIERLDRKARLGETFLHSKVRHRPIFSLNLRPGLLNKIFDFIYFPLVLRRVARRHAPDVVIARGAPAGALAFLLWRKTGIPFLVESFEPHSEYMNQSGVWSRFDLRYVFQRRWEERQKRFSLGLLPVSSNYGNALLADGVPPERIRVVPCVVDQTLFRFSDQRRRDIRDRFSIAPDAIVGIYAGKFGGLYLDDDSFKIYRIFFDEVKEFYLFILSPLEHHRDIHSRIRKYKLPEDRIFVSCVPHAQVADFCSASDFGFVTIASYESSAYCCPVKIGEYWSCGLPIVLTQGVGDESQIIENAKAGVLFDPRSINHSDFRPLIRRLLNMIGKRETRASLIEMVADARSIENLRLAYIHFLDVK